MFEDFWRPPTLEYIKRNSLYKLLSKYYDLELSEDPEFLLYSSFGYEYLKYDCARIFYAGENVRPNFKECDYAFSFDYPITDRNYRLPLYRLYPGYNKILEPRSYSRIPLKKRKFCCFLASNPDGVERNQFFELLSAYKKVDAGGKVFFNIDRPVPRGEEINWMSEYKFCIAFENSSYPGYTTEKLLNALVAGTVPIYWGNPLVERDFNPKAFINCQDFENLESVVNHVIKVDQDPNIYRAVMEEPILPDNKENDFCVEENIISIFEQIFSSKKTYIPVAKKKNQRLFYPFKQTKRVILRALNK